MDRDRRGGGVPLHVALDGPLRDRVRRGGDGAVDATDRDEHVDSMRPVLLVRGPVAPERGPALRAHALFRLRIARGLGGDDMSARDDVMTAALVLVRAAHAPTHQPVEYFSQRNADLLGLTKRGFLELLRRPDAPRSIRLGKTRLVRRSDMIDFLERLTVARAAEPPPQDGADEVLAELGCVVPRRGRVA